MTISDLKLEQLALGELSEQDASTLRSALVDDQEAASRLAEIQASNVTLLETYPPIGVRTEVERRVRVIDLRESTQRAGLASVPFLLRRLTVSLRWLAVAACVVGVMTFLVPEPQEQPDFRLKGNSAELVVHRVMGETAERLNQDSRVKAGDRLQVSILGAVGHHVVVVSVDGRGAVTLHYPRGEAPTKVSGQTFSLPTSYQLDDAPAYERFFLVSSREGLEAERVMKSLQHLVAGESAKDGHLADLPDGASVKTLTLVKGIP